MSDLSSTLSTRNEFVHRHIGPREEDVQTMLKVLGFGTLEEMANHVVPKNIRMQKPLSLGDGLAAGAWATCSAVAASA